MLRGRTGPITYMTGEQQKSRFIIVCCLFFGIFLCFPGVTLTAMGNSNFGDGAFESDHKVMRTIGPILLFLGLAMVVTAILLCVFLSRNRGQSPGSVLQTNQSPGIPIVTGMAPAQQPMVVPSPYAPQPAGVAGTYPGGYQAAPPPQTYPGAGYQPAGGAYHPGPQMQYGSQGAAYSVQPSVPIPPPEAPPMPPHGGSKMEPESAPPPSYDDVLKKGY